MRCIVSGALYRCLGFSYSAHYGEHLLLWSAQGSFSSPASGGNNLLFLAPTLHPCHPFMSPLEQSVATPTLWPQGRVSPPAVLCHLPVTGICSWGSTSINLGLSLGAPIGSLVGWYRPGLWATVSPSPPAKGALSLKAARAKGQRDREIGWHHLSLCIQLCLWPPYSWTSIFCFSCSALGTFVANEFWTTWTWSTVLSRFNLC